MSEVHFLHITLVILCDNMNIVALTHNPMMYSHTKHTELDLFFIREKVMAKQLQVIHVPAIDQRVDILTKVFTPLNFTTYKSKLIVVKRHFVNPS